MTALLEATGVVKRFGDTAALDGFDLAVEAGEIAGLVGHNGAGKSTFARVTAGLVTPGAGTVRVDGMNASRAADRVRPILGLAPQELALYPTATARENLFAFAGLSGLRRRDARRRIDQLAGALVLGDVLDRRVRDLSGGQQRRLQAATAMIHRPRVPPLDDPPPGPPPTPPRRRGGRVHDALPARARHPGRHPGRRRPRPGRGPGQPGGAARHRPGRRRRAAPDPRRPLPPPGPRLSRPSGVRLAAEVRHQSVLIARDPGPLIGYTVMGLLLITATRPLYAALSQFGLGSGESGIDRAAAGMAVMFSLFALKVGAAQLLNERTWHTWDRLRTSPAGFGEILVGKSLPILVAVVAQQAVLFGFAVAAFGLHPRAGWWALAACALAWSGCVLFLGIGAFTLARSPAQLSAAGDVFALLTTVLGGALVPVSLLPGWMRDVAPASPGYWALDAYRAALAGTPSQLGRPLAMLGVFALIGVAVAAGIGT